MKNITLSGVIHFLVFLASNGAIIALVPAQYKELATLICNFIIGVSAFIDSSYGDKVAGRS